MIINILAISSAGFLLGVFIGALIAINRYPFWEVSKMYRTYKNRTSSKNEWVHVYNFMDHTNHEIVKPNCDTLYSFTFINLSISNYRLCIPDIENRYYSFSFLRNNTDVLGYINNRNAGHNREFIITNQKDYISTNRPVIKLETNLCWIIARFGVYPSEDIADVNRIQNEVTICDE